MKRVLIGGFFSLIGMLGVLSVFLAAAANMQVLSGWTTPPGRFLSAVSELGFTPILVFSCIVLLTGFVLMGIEYFRKEGKKKANSIERNKQREDPKVRRHML